MTEQSADRLEVLARIAEYERDGKFDVDVENDPPTKKLLPEHIDYTGKKLITRLKTAFANFVARKYFDGRIKRKELIIKDIIGIENYLAVQGGAILTCNHFNANDNYAVYKVIQKYLKRRNLYKIIREGNYTAFGGIYGFFFRNCNTLPLSSGYRTMKLFLSGVKTLLARGEKILIYPEQAMWWNYKKPRPLKSGAFNIAARNNVPVVPFFITMNDSDVMGKDGFYIQEYTMHISPAIYPDDKFDVKVNAEEMAKRNFAVWQEIYERVYGKPLAYTED